MKPEMITMKVGQATIKVPASVVAQSLLAGVLTQLQPAAPTVAAGPVPALGEYWPGQGGVNAGLVRGWGGVRDYYLIVARGAEDEFEDLAYGPRDCEVAGADSAWDGLANTKALLASGHSHPAAEAAAGFTCDGHTDFYLPARRELQLAEANVPDVFSKAWHWSSSQRSALHAFGMTFVDGSQYLNAKDYEGRVRPVRRLFI